MGFLDGITRAETLKLMREQIDTPELPPPRSAEDDRVRDAFGAAPERIAGFVFIGTPARPLEERPRPDLATAVTTWAP